MMLRVETRQISKRDWMWMVRCWEGDTIESGHCKSKGEAMEDGRAAKKYQLRKLKDRGNNGRRNKKNGKPNT